MRKIISISERRFLGSYLQDQMRQPKFDRSLFLGVVSTLVAPQLVFCFFFGTFFALVFGVCALGGSGFGIRAARKIDSPFVELRLSSAAQTLVSSEPRLRKQG